MHIAYAVRRVGPGNLDPASQIARDGPHGAAADDWRDGGRALVYVSRRNVHREHGVLGVKQRRIEREREREDESRDVTSRQRATAGGTR